MKQIIWYLLAGTRGGETRCQILNSLLKEPANMNQLSTRLGLDYKTIKHHIEILEKNCLIVSVNRGGYGAMFFLSPEFEENMQVFGEIWEKLGKK